MIATINRIYTMRVIVYCTFTAHSFLFCPIQIAQIRIENTGRKKSVGQLLESWRKTYAVGPLANTVVTRFIFRHGSMTAIIPMGNVICSAEWSGGYSHNARPIICTVCQL